MASRDDSKSRLRIPAVLALALCLTAPALAQGDTGFLRGKGNLDLALSYSLDTYDEFWIGENKTSGGFGRIERHTANLYAAYGATDEIDLVLNVAGVVATADRIHPDEGSIQDLAVGVKMRVLSTECGPGRLSFLAFPGVKAPLSHYEDNAVTAIGDGQVDLRLRGVIQYALPSGVFFALETGYDFRFDAPPDEVPIHLSVGGTIGPATITGFYSRIESLGGYDIGQGPFPGVEEEYDRVGAGLYWRLSEQLGLSASGWTTLDGKNTGDVDGFSVGMVLRF